MSLPGSRRDYNFDESKLKQGQRKCAILMVEYEFADKGEKMTQQQIADEVGVHRTTIHEWNTRDSNYIEYKNYLAANAMNAFLPFVYRKLIDGINNGSMKGIELYLKRIGDMDTKSEVTVNDNKSDEKTFEDRKADILARLGNDAGAMADTLEETVTEEEAPPTESKPFSKDG